MSSGKGLVSDDLDAVLMCKTMQWSYHTYLAQPTWFLDTLKIVMNCEAEYQNRMAKMSQRKSNRR